MEIKTKSHRNAIISSISEVLKVEALKISTPVFKATSCSTVLIAMLSSRVESSISAAWTVMNKPASRHILSIETKSSNRPLCGLPLKSTPTTTLSLDVFRTAMSKVSAFSSMLLDLSMLRSNLTVIVSPCRRLCASITDATKSVYSTLVVPSVLSGQN